MKKQLNYCDAIAMSYFAPNPSVFFRLLHANRKLSAGTYWLYDLVARTHAIETEENCEQKSSDFFILALQEALEIGP